MSESFFKRKFCRGDKHNRSCQLRVLYLKREEKTLKNRKKTLSLQTRFQNESAYKVLPKEMIRLNKQKNGGVTSRKINTSKLKQADIDFSWANLFLLFLKRRSHSQYSRNSP